MSLLKRIKNLTHYLVNDDGFTVPGNSGPPLPTTFSASKSLANAHLNPVVCAATNWITDQASTTSAVLRRVLPDDNVEVFTSHDFLDLLSTPSEFLSGRELLSVSIWDLILKGQFFWHKDRTDAGRLGGLTYLPATMVEVVGSRKELITRYRYNPEGVGGHIDYNVDEVVHVRLKPDPIDPKNGLSPLVCVARELYIHELAEEYTQNFLSTQGAPAGLLMPAQDDKVLTQLIADTTRDYIRYNFAGTKRDQLGVLRAKMEYINTSIDPQTMTLRTMQTTAQELICGVLGIHPVILGVGAGAAQSRVGAATKEFERAAWANRIMPIQDTIAEQIGRQLLPEFVPPEEDTKWSVDWDRSGVMSLQPDKLQEATRWAMGVKAGYLQVYDARQAQGLEAEDSDKVYLRASNILPVLPGTPPPVLPPIDETPRAPDDEPEERSRTAKMLVNFTRSKAELDSEQRTLLLTLARDAEYLESKFTDTLTDAFEDLGVRAVNAFWDVENGKSIHAIDYFEFKQTDEEIAAEAARVLRSVPVTVWTRDVLTPAWNAHTLQVLNTTVGSVNTTLGLAVNIPDPVSRQIIAQGGTQLGLIDVAGQTRDSIFRALHEGRSLGEGPIDLARRIREQVPAGPFPNAGSKYRAKLIARTETAYAQNISAVETYKQSDVFAGLIISDGDEDEVCAALDGRRVSFEEFEVIGPTSHPNCTRAVAPVREL